jgi:hypothetical protein
LYRDIIAAIDSDPTSAIAQALVDRWLSVVQGASPQAAIRTGLIKAWADREHWPAFLKRRVAEYDIERATVHRRSIVGTLGGGSPRTRACRGARAATRQ